MSGWRKRRAFAKRYVAMVVRFRNDLSPVERRRHWVNACRYLDLGVSPVAMLSADDLHHPAPLSARQLAKTGRRR